MVKAQRIDLRIAVKFRVGALGTEVGDVMSTIASGRVLPVEGNNVWLTISVDQKHVVRAIVTVDNGLWSTVSFEKEFRELLSDSAYDVFTPSMK